MTHSLDQLADTLNISLSVAAKAFSTYARVIGHPPARGSRNTVLIPDEFFGDLTASYALARRVNLPFEKLLLFRRDQSALFKDYFEGRIVSMNVPPLSRLQGDELEKLRASDEVTQQKLDQLLARSSSAPDYQPFAEDIQKIKRNQEDLLRAVLAKQSASPVPAPAPVTKE